MMGRVHGVGWVVWGGERTVTYVFTDGAGSTAECSFTVTVTEGRCHLFVGCRGVSEVRVRVGWG